MDASSGPVTPAFVTAEITGRTTWAREVHCLVCWVGLFPWGAEERI